MSARASLSERLFNALLWLYPRAFREQFGRDMRDFFADKLRGARRERGIAGVARLWLGVLPDSLTAAFLEQAAGLRTRFHGARNLGDNLRRAQAQISERRKGDSMLHTFAQDLRYTVRALRRSPVFTLVAVLVIALGTGSVTTIFSAANSLVLRPLPGTSKPGELMEVQRTGKDGIGSMTVSASYPYFRALRDRSRTLSGLAAWTMVQLTVSTGAEGTTSLGNLVSANYFDVMGVRPAVGRFFLADEDSVPGAKPVVVLSHAFWSRRFGSDSSVVGRTVHINSHPFTVIGVAARGFRGVYTPLNTDVWVPMMMQQTVRPGGLLLLQSSAGWLSLVGRAREGRSQAVIARELSSLTEDIAKTSENAFYQKFSGVRVASVFGLPTESKGPIYGFTALLLAVSSLVLLIASANVAGMLLARATTRRREMALRVALGAGRGRIVRQLLTESVLLFLAGGTGGVILAVMGARALERVPLPAEFPMLLDLSPDGRVLAFALGISLFTGLVFGMAPAFAAARSDVASQLRSDTAGAGARRSSARSVLVVGQLALSLMLLVSAGLFVRAFNRGLRVNPGFNSDGVSVAAFDASTYGYNEAQSRVFYSGLKTRLQARAGVIAVSFARMLPLGGSNSGDEFHIDGYTPKPDEIEHGVAVMISQVDFDYFSALGIPLVRGRAFQNSDGPGAARVAIINQWFADRYWKDSDAIGRTFRRDSTVFTVVGVVSNSKFASLNDEDRPFAYFPLAQSFSAAQNLVVHSSMSPSSAALVIREAVKALGPNLPIPQTTTLKQFTSASLLPQRLAAIVTGSLGVLGLILAAVGLYGIVAYSVSQRTREIGVRMALGATTGNVVGMVVREGMRLVIIGTVIGMVLSLGATRALSSFLFGVSATDAMTFVAVPLVLVMVAAVASYLPARKAATAEPVSALRAD